MMTFNREPDDGEYGECHILSKGSRCGCALCRLDLKIGQLQKENKRLREALEAVVERQEAIGISFFGMGTTRRIARDALDCQATSQPEPGDSP